METEATPNIHAKRKAYAAHAIPHPGRKSVERILDNWDLHRLEYNRREDMVGIYGSRTKQRFHLDMEIM